MFLDTGCLCTRSGAQVDFNFQRKNYTFLKTKTKTPIPRRRSLSRQGDRPITHQLTVSATCLPLRCCAPSATSPPLRHFLPPATRPCHLLCPSSPVQVRERARGAMDLRSHRCRVWPDWGMSARAAQLLRGLPATSPSRLVGLTPLALSTGSASSSCFSVSILAWSLSSTRASSTSSSRLLGDPSQERFCTELMKIPGIEVCMQV